LSETVNGSQEFPASATMMPQASERYQRKNTSGLRGTLNNPHHLRSGATQIWTNTCLNIGLGIRHHHRRVIIWVRGDPKRAINLATSGMVLAWIKGGSL